MPSDAGTQMPSDATTPMPGGGNIQDSQTPVPTLGCARQEGVVPGAAETGFWLHQRGWGSGSWGTPGWKSTGWGSSSWGTTRGQGGGTGNWENWEHGARKWPHPPYRSARDGPTPSEDASPAPMSPDQTGQATSQAEAPTASTEAPATEAPHKWTELEWHDWIESKLKARREHPQWTAQDLRVWEKKWRPSAHADNRWLHGAIPTVLL